MIQKKKKNRIKENMNHSKIPKLTTKETILWFFLGNVDVGRFITQTNNRIHFVITSAFPLSSLDKFFFVLFDFISFECYSCETICAIRFRFSSNKTEIIWFILNRIICSFFIQYAVIVYLLSCIIYNRNLNEGKYLVIMSIFFFV